MEPTSQGEVAKLSQVIQIDEGKIQEHLGEVVRSTVEETLNALLDAEADRLCQAERYERTEARQDTRAGSYQRQLHTKAGPVRLKVPKLRSLPFETAIIERYKRRESSVEEALVEMYLAGVSVRRVEDITEALWGTRVSPSTVSELNQKIYAQIEAWRNRPIEGNHAYVFLDGLWLKRSWGGEVRNVSLLVAMGVNEEGFREVLAVAEGAKEDKASWTAFLRHLKERGLKGIRLFISDKCLGLVAIFLAPPPLHRQPFLPVQPIHSLVVDLPPQPSVRGLFPPKENVQPPIAESWTLACQLAQPSPQRHFVPFSSLVSPASAVHPDQPTGASLTESYFFPYDAHRFSLRPRAYHFFASTTFSASRSSACCATILFSRPFSSSIWRSRRVSLTSMPPYFAFQW